MGKGITMLVISFIMDSLKIIFYMGKANKKGKIITLRDHISLEAKNMDFSNILVTFIKEPFKMIIFKVKVH